MSQKNLPGEDLEGCSAGADTGVYLRYGPVIPTSPVIISVPHAGRAYPDSIWQRSRLSPVRMQEMEDRYVDLLVAPLIRANYAVLVAQAPRALIDLNRDERDIDTRLVQNIPHNQPLIESAKQRGGLGLFPRSLPRAGDLWRGVMDWSEAVSRIENIHKPYHQALTQMLGRACAAHGHAVLLDIHSMPPLTRVGQKNPDMVIGDRFGVSAASRFSATATAVIAGRGYEVALNHPYAGSHMLDKHGRPVRGIHALQLEVSRALYLCPKLSEPGDGLNETREMVLALVEALAEELRNNDWAIAAE